MRAVAEAVLQSVDDQVLLHLGHGMADEGTADGLLRKTDKNPNTKGAELLSFFGNNSELQKVFNQTASGEIDQWVVFGQDLLTQFPAAKESFPKLKSVLFVGSNENAMSLQAHFVLPSATVIEKSGTLTNFEGRVQSFGKILEPMGEACAAIQILTDLARSLGLKWEAMSAEKIYQELTSKEEAFPKKSFSELSGVPSEIRVQAAPTIPALQQYDNIL